jgi:hypothetical protein
MSQNLASNIQIFASALIVRQAASKKGPADWLVLFCCVQILLCSKQGLFRIRRLCFILLKRRAPKSTQDIPVTLTENSAALDHPLQKSIKISLLTNRFINPRPSMADCTAGFDCTLKFITARQTMNIVNCSGNCNG